ncbi:DUF7001 family protein [Halocatena halophila]|uniref:DUF7001 family protein n=1 Tax=Halocatena halophila TaxID=2814576 RepID=UPI0038B3532E
MVTALSLYRAPTTVADSDAIADWLAPRIAPSVSVRDRFCSRHGDDELARAFARARVNGPYDRSTGSEMFGIIRYEERALETPDRAGGVLYDGRAIQDALRERLPDGERGLSNVHIILIDRVLGTWGDHDGRWHKRVSILGQPTLISVPGLYEAPAKPEQYYKAQQRHALISGDTPPREVLETEIEGEFLIEDDPRTTDALCGYALSAFHFLDTGTAFCDVGHCRLADRHRHPGVIEAQLRDPEFCVDHAELYDID